MLSIVTPTLNNVSGLEKTYSSIKNIENFLLKEWIIIDSYSIDQTVEFIKKIKKSNKSKFDINYINIPKSGPYSAMNYGIKLAKQKYIWIINSGDAILEFNEEQFMKIKFTNKEDSSSIIFGKVLRIDKNKKFIIGDKEFCNKSKFRLNEVHPSIIIPKFLYKKYGSYNKKFNIAADLDLLLRFRSLGVKFIFMDKLYVSFPYGGLSSKKFEGFCNMVKIITINNMELKGRIYLLLRYLYSRLRALI